MLENLLRTQGAQLFNQSHTVSIRQSIGKWMVSTHDLTEYGLLAREFQLFTDLESAVAEFSRLSAEAPLYSNLCLPVWKI